MDSGKFWRWARLVLNISPHLEQHDEQELIQSLVSSRRFAIVPELRIGHGSKFLVEAVLKAVCEGTTSKLKSLFIWNTQGSTDAALLSRASVKVEKFTLRSEQTSKMQLQFILTAVVESGDLALKTLDLGYKNNLAGISPEILGGAAMRLETLRVRPLNSC